MERKISKYIKNFRWMYTCNVSSKEFFSDIIILSGPISSFFDNPAASLGYACTHIHTITTDIRTKANQDYFINSLFLPLSFSDTSQDF